MSSYKVMSTNKPYKKKDDKIEKFKTLLGVISFVDESKNLIKFKIESNNDKKIHLTLYIQKAIVKVKLLITQNDVPIGIYQNIVDSNSKIIYVERNNTLPADFLPDDLLEDPENPKSITFENTSKIKNVHGNNYSQIEFYIAPMAPKRIEFDGPAYNTKNNENRPNVVVSESTSRYQFVGYNSVIVDQSIKIIIDSVIQ
ncbi:ORF MSV030 hypothetical protein [Melanoplus sanguinipes entomopoxvirus]|uniref:Uncharacterized protein n=1 Tax=Melanoplus sanguinipes entomopoxvirus TaxID=83191 RepID=Q9YW62_MSEPV|nr:ORF MSV030 hypothetical protein [Melanoplus sanguinipes entomopoxvirus]AAC97842.1 ORF MSV030 hypothetical protein [Melanoplus sanguinipes entomopoxvirus 'O']